MMSTLAVVIQGKTFMIEVDLAALSTPPVRVKVDGEWVEVNLPDLGLPMENMEWVVVDDRPYEVILDRDLRWIRTHEGIYSIEVRDQSQNGLRRRKSDGRVKAPIPGQIMQVMVRAGERVEAGQPLLILEAMKMENEIRSPLSGKVLSVNIRVGQTVSLGETLIEISGRA